MTQGAQGELIYLNGIDGEKGTYAFEPLTIEDLKNAAVRQVWSPEHWDDLQVREFNKETHYQVLPQFGEGDDLKRTRWGIIFPAGADPGQVDQILLAVDKLVSLREKQMGRKAKIYRGSAGFQWVTDPGTNHPRPETKNEWLSRNGAGPGQVDPTIVPYYLLIVADPQSIPYIFQYELDVQYAVGRIYFDTLDEYTRYAASVEAAASSAVKLKRRAVLFGVTNPGDKATTLSTRHLIRPLKAYFDQNMADLGVNWETSLVEPDDADRATLKTLLGGSQSPALLFTASHGVKFSYMNPDQYHLQGGLVCRDWNGPGGPGLTREHYLAAEDIPDSANLLGSIIFNFACFGAGTPYWDDYAILRRQNRTAMTARPFISALPRRLLTLPGGGALAVIGHIDRAWNFSFQWEGIEEQNTAYQGFLYQLMAGAPVGLAMESMNDRYADISSMLATTLQNLKYNQSPSPADLANAALEFAQCNDARAYAIIGDPAVSIPLVENPSDVEVRPVLVLGGSASPARLPVVFDPQALSGMNENERKAVEAENNGLPYPKSAAPAPVLPIVPDPKPVIRSSTPVQGEPAAPARPNQPVSHSFATPMDGLAFALQVYTSEDSVSFDLGIEGVPFNILDDAREKIKDVVVNLNSALGNLAKKMEQATSDLATLQVITGVVDDLDTFDPKTAEKRILTRISAGGDIEVYLPNNGPDLDEELIALHQSMVRQALTNRLEVARAVADMVAGLFSGQQK